MSKTKRLLKKCHILLHISNRILFYEADLTWSVDMVIWGIVESNMINMQFFYNDVHPVITKGDKFKIH